MISWIQRNFQRHFKLIFILVLVGLGIPFVVTIGSTPGLTQPDRKVKTATFFGYNLESEQDRSRIDNDGRLSAELQFGGDASPNQVAFYAYQRIAALHLADVMHIPPANPSELPDFIKNLRLFAGPNGAFDVTRYDQFRKNLGSSAGISEAEIAHVLADDVRAQKIEPLLAGPGYVLPSEVAAIIKQGDTTWTISSVTVDYASYDPGVALTDADLAKYFADNSFRYTIPPRVSAEAVNFFSFSYLGQVPEPSEAQIRQFYDANPGRFPKPPEKAEPGKAPVVKPNPEADFAAVKTQVKTELKLDEAKKLAVKAGSDFAFALYDGKISRGAAFDAYVAAHNFKPVQLTPFTKDAGPMEFGGGRDLANAAFELNADRYYSEALPTPLGAAVLIWEDSLPAHEPTLAEVKDKVKADALDNAKQKSFAEFGLSLRAGIERRLKEGESFEKAAEEAAGSTKIAVKSYPAFKYSASPKDLDTKTLDLLQHLAKGEVSDMETTEDKGILVYAQDRTDPVVDPSSKQYAVLKGQMSQVYAREDSISLLSSLVENELKKAEPNPR